jgi:energy-coupling factor transporter transmembrane protein EcfT
MEHHSAPQKLPSWLMLVIFLVIMAVLFFLGDTFTFVLGLLVMSIIFASGYDKNPANHEHH